MFADPEELIRNGAIPYNEPYLGHIEILADGFTMSGKGYISKHNKAEIIGYGKFGCGYCGGCKLSGCPGEATVKFEGVVHALCGVFGSHLMKNEAKIRGWKKCRDNNLPFFKYKRMIRINSEVG